MRARTAFPPDRSTGSTTTPPSRFIGSRLVNHPERFPFRHEFLPRLLPILPQRPVDRLVLPLLPVRAVDVLIDRAAHVAERVEVERDAAHEDHEIVVVFHG